MTLQDTSPAPTGGDRSRRQIVQLGLLLGGGAAVAVLAVHGIGIADCLSMGGQLRLEGCVQNIGNSEMTPALIPIAG